MQMGLAMDADGIPLHYDLFPGNTVDKETFRPIIGEVRRNYDTGRVIVVADMGIVTGIIFITFREKRKVKISTVIFSFRLEWY